MKKWSATHIKKRATRAYNRVGGSDVVKRRDIATDFAHKHGLIYFHTVNAKNETAPVIRGSTAIPAQVDSNFCIGSHAGYDMVLIERAADVSYPGFDSTFHRWYVLEIDLKRSTTLPFIFLGTKQLTKAFYARVLTSHRDVRHLQLVSSSSHQATFHSNYAIIASPRDLQLLHTIFNDEVIELIASNKVPFAMEIEGDSLIIFTEVNKPSEQLLDKLLHYGLWVAKQIDEKLN